VLDFLVAGACAAARQAEYKLSPDRCLNEGILRTLDARVKAFPVLCEVGAEEPLIRNPKNKATSKRALGAILSRWCS
jgi:hypothetical protein